MKIICTLLVPILMLYIRKCFIKDINRSTKRKLLRYFMALILELCVILMVIRPMENHVHEKVLVGVEVVVFAALVIIFPTLEYCVRFPSKIKTLWKQAVVMLYALVLSFANLIRCFDNSFWADEAYSINLSQMSIVDIIHDTAVDVHPPLYYFILKLGKQIGGGGYGGTVHHLVSFIPFLLIIIVAVTLIRKEFGYIPAVILVTFAAFSDSALTYNVEVRMYSWAAFFCLMSFYCCYKILLSNQWKYWILFMTFSLCAAYTHYYALITVGFYYAAFLPLSIREKKYFKKLFIIGAMTVVGYLPWLTVLLKSFRRTAESWWLEEIPTAGDCFLFLFDHAWMFVVVICALALFILYESGIMTVKKERYLLEHRMPCNVCIEFQNPTNLCRNEIIWLVFGVCSVVGTVVVGLFLSYTIRPLFQIKYLFPAAGAAWLCFGVAISKMRGRYLWCCLITTLFLLQGIPTYCIKTYNEFLLNQNISMLQKEVQLDETDVIFTNIYHLSWTILEYYFPDTSSVLVEDTDLFLDSHTDKTIWLFWLGEINDETVTNIEKRGYVYDCIWNGVLEVGGEVCVYHLSK